MWFPVAVWWSFTNYNTLFTLLYFIVRNLTDPVNADRNKTLIATKIGIYILRRWRNIVIVISHCSWRILFIRWFRNPRIGWAKILEYQDLKYFTSHIYIIRASDLCLMLDYVRVINFHIIIIISILCCASCSLFRIPLHNWSLAHAAVIILRWYYANIIFCQSKSLSGSKWHAWFASRCLGRRLSTWQTTTALCLTALGTCCRQLTFWLAWYRKHSAVMATELLQLRDLTCGTLFRSSCAIQTSSTACSDDSWRDTLFTKHEHGAL